MKRFAPLAVAAFVGMSACTDETTAPLSPETFSLNAATASGIDVAKDAVPTDRHLLVASQSNRLPRDLAARVAALGGRIDAGYDRIGVAVLSGLSDEAAAQLQAGDDIQTVEREQEIQWIDPVGSLEVMAAEGEGAASMTPNTASFFPRQWHLRAIGADAAWAAGRVGSPNVTVAILDTGIDPTHADLVGLVDAERSASFVPADDALIAANFPGAPSWIDLHYHGTHVAATVSSNASAAAGVTSKVTLMAVKVLGANGRSAAGSVLGGIMHAADNGADVINMSLGGAFRKSLNPGYVSVINRAITYANRQGVVIVVAAGNDNYDLDSDSDIYNSYCMSTHVVCVSATGPTARASVNGPWTNIDAKASYSNFGSFISVAAPGGNGASSVTAACSSFSLPVPVCQTGTYVIGISGTSMAAPHVAGLAALVVEDIGKKQPMLVANRIMQRADDLGVEGRDVIYGRGRINVAKALGL
jgi:lantibiotic leader peptide-processing serine protease